MDECECMVIYGQSVVSRPFPNHANLYLNVLHAACMCSPELLTDRLLHDCTSRACMLYTVNVHDGTDIVCNVSWICMQIDSYL